MDERDRRMAALLHHRTDRRERGEPIAPPIVAASAFHLPGPPEGADGYARHDSPTWRHVEAAISTLEDAPVVAFPSGMAAVHAVLGTQVRAGDRVVLAADGYYTVRLLAERHLEPFGIEVETVATTAAETADYAGARLVWIETPSNPGLDACDIAIVADRAHAAGALLVVDNTTMTPLLQRPLELGADVVVASDTKAMAGHSDVLFGHVATRDADVVAALREWRKVTGAVPGPFEAWQVHRGLLTLDVRLQRSCANAAAIAAAAASHPSVVSVRHPSLPTDPAHRFVGTQMDAGGFLVGMTLPTAEAADAFVDTCPMIVPATSFGGVHTTAERRARWGEDVDPGLVRLSAGIEPTDALVAAIVATLDDLPRP